MTRVLLIMSAQDDALANEILARVDRPPVALIDRVTTRHKALERMKLMPANLPYDLIVVGAQLAHDADASVAQDGGLRCCKAVRLRSQAPLLLLVPKLTNNISTACAEILEPHPVAVEVTADIAEVVAGHVRMHRPPPRQLDVVIAVENGRWKYELKGVGFEYKKNGKLKVTSANLVDWTHDREHAEQWMIDFNRIGKSIKTCLTQDNRAFHDRLSEATTIAGEHSDTRVSFVVDRNNYELVLEAVVNPSDGVQDPWMLHAPMLRNIVRKGRTVAGLFQPPLRPLRCLLICADASGYVNNLAAADGSALKLRELPLVAKECEDIESLLRRAVELSPKVDIDEIQVLRTTPAAGPVTRDRLLQALRVTKKPWDIIHFAGHSHFSSAQTGGGSAYVFLHGKDGADAVPFSLLAPYFRLTRCLYLNSCESSSSAFALAAMDHGVDTVIGYRHPVDDEAALVQAKLFYRALIRNLAVDKAFLRARRLSRRLRRDTWASAMLVTAHQDLAAGRR